MVNPLLSARTKYKFLNVKSALSAMLDQNAVTSGEKKPMDETMLELNDIQSAVLRPRPTPYVATYIGLRIDDRKPGRELMQRVSTAVTSADHPNSPLADTWVSVALSYSGLGALGVPQESLDSLSWEFRQGMVARAKDLGDVGDSDPQNWEKPFRTSDVHVILVAVSPD